MNKRLKALIFFLALLSFIAAWSAPILGGPPPKQPTWAELRPAQQKILAPLKEEWDRLPEPRRRQLLLTVNRYPRMTQAQQQRFSRRLLKWNTIPKDQRVLARARFKAFKSLPVSRRAEIKRRWLEQHPPKTTQPAPSMAAPLPAAPPTTNQ